MMIGERVESRTSLSEEDDALSRCLIDARLKAQPLPDYPGQLPETLEQAYAIQAASIERWPEDVAGWKVAKLPPADRSRFSVERLVGPVFRPAIRKIEPGSCTVMPVYQGGMAAVEAELVLELGVTVPPSGKDYSDGELMELVSAVYCGAEIASSPMAVVNQRGATSIISDLGINAGVIVGPEITDWRSLPPGSPAVTVTVDDVLAGKAAVDAIVDGPLQALRFLMGISARHGCELPAGSLVSSGAITGVHDVRMSSIARVDYGSFGWFDLRFEPIRGKR